MRMILLKRVSLLLAAAACAAGQAPLQLRIAALDSLASKAKESVDITLDSSMLKAASGLLGDPNKSPDDPKKKKLLENLKGMTLRSFEFDKEGQYRMEDLEPIRAQLKAPGWNRIINVQSKDEISEIYMRTEQGNVVGFAIIAAE